MSYSKPTWLQQHQADYSQSSHLITVGHTEFVHLNSIHMLFIFVALVRCQGVEGFGLRRAFLGYDISFHYFLFILAIYSLSQDHDPTVPRLPRPPLKTPSTPFLSSPLSPPPPPFPSPLVSPPLTSHSLPSHLTQPHTSPHLAAPFLTPHHPYHP